MTISVSPLFEKGKIYSLNVLFVNKPGKYVNAQYKDGTAFRIEVPVEPVKGIAALATAMLGCADAHGGWISRKWNYVRNNPVRKGLAMTADDWPYQGCENVLEWHD